MKFVKLKFNIRLFPRLKKKKKKKEFLYAMFKRTFVFVCLISSYYGLYQKRKLMKMPKGILKHPFN